MGTEELKNHWILKVGKILLNSAPFALLLSILFFFLGSKDMNNAMSGLRKIEQSLSTTHLGIFPNYLKDINERILDSANFSQKEKESTNIIIFEDVLFYGAVSDADEFMNTVLNITHLAQMGYPITVVYYDNTTGVSGKGQRFREVVQESWLRKDDLNPLSLERFEMMRDTTFLAELTPSARFVKIDSILCEKYFDNLKNSDDRSERRDLTNVIQKLRKPFIMTSDKRGQPIDIKIAATDTGAFKLFFTMDSIRRTHLGAQDIHYANLSATYYEFTDAIKEYYSSIGINLLPLNEYLTMSCWSNGDEVLFALPGKFAADEIGFISHDKAIIEYVKTMLEGVEHSIKQSN